MKKSYWLLGSCVAAALTVAACGDDDGDNGGGGEAGGGAGTGGEGGSAMTGGNSGRGGGGSSNGGSGAVGGSDGGAGEGGAGEGGAGDGGAGDGGAGNPSGGTGGPPGGAGGMTAGSGGAAVAGFGGAGGTTAGSGGSVGKAGGAGTAGAGGSAGTSAGAGGGAGTCTGVSPSSDWNYGNDAQPGIYSYFAAFLRPNVAGPGSDNFFFGFYDNPGDGELTGVFALGQGHDANYATCSRCFFVLADTAAFFATSGTLVISSDSTQMTGVIHATLTDATFVEVTIDDLTSESTPVPNGLCVRVSAMAFSVP